MTLLGLGGWQIPLPTLTHWDSIVWLRNWFIALVGITLVTNIPKRKSFLLILVHYVFSQDWVAVSWPCLPKLVDRNVTVVMLDLLSQRRKFSCWLQTSGEEMSLKETLVAVSKWNVCNIQRQFISFCRTFFINNIWCEMLKKAYYPKRII